MQNQEITISDILTPQEHYLIGGTPPMELVKTDSDFYKPFGLLTKAFTLEEIIQKRKELKAFSGLATHHLLGDASLALSLEDLDNIAQTTLRDPKVVEILTDGKVVQKPEVTESFYLNYLASFKAAEKPFEGRLRDYNISIGPEYKG